MKTLTFMLSLFAISNFAYADQTSHIDLGDVGPGTPIAEGETGHQVPDWKDLGEEHFAEAVKRGYSLFVNTQQVAPQGFTNNGLNCVNCHLDGGQKAGAAPMWAAYVSYPAWRGKNKKINTYADRLQGCFMYSMNAKDGTPPNATSETILDLTAYSYWLATNAQVNPKIAGRSFPKVDKPELAPDADRGHAIYQAQCAMCHGEEGEGRQVGERYVFPPLWGKDSYNWGAGMHKISTAANFIKANMPLSRGNTLTDQQAWDVSFYINTHERPQDPRMKASVAETAKAYHASDSQYGQASPSDGHILGSKAF